MKRKHLISLLAIVVAFAVLLPLYYLFSSGKNDALEQTIEEGNGTTSETYTAPLSYGETYPESLLFGVLGIIVVFAVSYLLLFVVRRMRRRIDE
jgi:ABC-type Fe3+ transport system permease subunit